MTRLASIEVLIAVCLVLVGCAGAAHDASTPSARGRPVNVVLVVADDLGYGDLGCYGQTKIHTPHIDALARDGVRFTQHYSGAPVCAPSRCVLMTGQASGHASIRDNLEHSPEGQEPMAASDATIAELLRERGYVCGGFGKWGLGFPGSDGDPLRRGFDHFYGYNCQRHAHTYYPTYLWDDGERVELPGNVDIDGDGRGDGELQYAQDLIDEALLAFLDANRERPFFCYVPCTLPHLALEIPDEELAPYLGAWDETPYTGASYTHHPTPRACYAAMVTRLDATVGKIVARLDALGLADDTLVLFTSDNGPTHVAAQVDVAFFESTGGLRGLKGSVFEGGLRVPLIARWPGRVEPGRVSAHICAFEDVLPTLCDVTSATPPLAIDGLSFLPTLLGEPQPERAFLAWDFPGYGGQLAVRRGRWKAVRRDLVRNPDAPLELYDIELDPAETNDLAGDHPTIASELAALMLDARTPPTIPAFRFGEYRAAD
jgi:arylsulfatase A-like enzyme